MTTYGSKAKNLLQLSESGINVPAFIVIDNKDITEDGLSHLLSDSVLTGKKTLSVRSSSALEDTKTLSFAGQFKTFLNVPADKVFSKVKKCFDATSSKNLNTYLEKMGMADKPIKMSVIVQEMINSDYSGVIFTANPQGILNEMVIAVGFGTGNKVVEDKTPVSTYYYNTDDKLYYSETRDRSPTLTNEMIEALIDLSADIREIFGREMDIEFAVKNNVIHILQARPITTLASRNISVLDNSNLVESYPGITLPLSASFIQYPHFWHKHISGFCLSAFRVLSTQEVLSLKAD